MIPAFVEASGFLPCGRFSSTVEEVEAELVSGGVFVESPTRENVWRNFRTLVELIKRRKVRVPAAFIGGSFVSNRIDPPDIDTALIIDMSRITNQDTFTAISKIARQAKENKLEVDAFIIPWHPDGSDYGADPQYCIERGHWDDFWQRYVPKNERQPPQRSHAMPVRGYLEVILDGYA